MKPKWKCELNAKSIYNYDYIVELLYQKVLYNAWEFPQMQFPHHIDRG